MVMKKKHGKKISIYTKCIISQINKTFKCKKGVPHTFDVACNLILPVAL
jgi:hypothetical protein